MTINTKWCLMYKKNFEQKRSVQTATMHPSIHYDE